MLTVSVLIVNYNSGERLANVYRALERQTFNDFELIVLDNASEDGSENAAPPKGLPVRVIKNIENTGFAGGVMDGAAHANGRLLVFLNPDAYPEPDWLKALVAAAERDGPSAIHGSVQLNADDPETLDGLGDVYHVSGVAWRGAFGKPRSRYPMTDDREIFAPCFAAAMVDREWFFSIGGLDRDFFCYHEDVDFGFRHRLRGGRAVLVRDAIVHHEGSAITGRYSDFTVYHGIRNRFWTLIKNMPLVLMPVAIPIFLAFSAAFLLRSFMLGIGKPYVRGWMAGFLGTPKIWRQRRSAHGGSPAPWTAIAKAMVWSPIAPFRRAPDLRPWPDEKRIGESD